MTGADLYGRIVERYHVKRGVARCPAHDDKTPSLSVKLDGDRVLVHCHAGCTQEDVIDAMRRDGVWPESNGNGFGLGLHIEPVLSSPPPAASEDAKAIEDEQAAADREAVLRLLPTDAPELVIDAVRQLRDRPPLDKAVRILQLLADDAGWQALSGTIKAGVSDAVLRGGLPRPVVESIIGRWDSYRLEWRPATTQAEAEGGGAGWTSAADVVPRHVPWVWKKRLAAGEVTVLDGDPGEGKSLIAAALAGSVTSGCAFPDGDLPREPGRVCWIGHVGEDHPAYTTVPRLTASGADLARVDILDATADADLGAACQSAAERKPTLAVIDSWAAWTDGTDNNNPEAVRTRYKALQPLRDAGTAIVVIMHDRKSEIEEGRSAVLRASGTVQAVAAPRMVLRVDHGVLTQTKGNLGGKGANLGFEVDGSGKMKRDPVAT